MTLHEMIADKLERADPETRKALLRIPLENIDRRVSNEPVDQALAEIKRDSRRREVVRRPLRR